MKIRYVIIVLPIGVIGIALLATTVFPLQTYPNSANLHEKPGLEPTLCASPALQVDQLPFTQSNFHLLLGEYAKYVQAKHGYDEFANYFGCTGLKVKLFL